MEFEGETGAKSIKITSVQICQICGDNVGTSVDGESFVACSVCAFPMYRPDCGYERKDGNQSCPQCKTRYRRQKAIVVVLAATMAVCCCCLRHQHLQLSLLFILHHQQSLFLLVLLLCLHPRKSQTK